MPDPTPVTATAPAPPPAPRPGAPGRGARLATPEFVLLALLIGELVWFSLAGTNFLTLDNGLEIVRASTEVGLLALALTPAVGDEPEEDVTTFTVSRIPLHGD